MDSAANSLVGGFAPINRMVWIRPLGFTIEVHDRLLLYKEYDATDLNADVSGRYS